MKEYIKRGYYLIPASTQQDIYAFFKQMTHLLEREPENFIFGDSELVMFVTPNAHLIASEDRDEITLANQSFVIKYRCSEDRAYLKGIQDFAYIQKIILAINLKIDRDIFNRDESMSLSLTDKMSDKDLIESLTNLFERLLKSNEYQKFTLYDLYYTDKCRIVYMPECSIIAIESPLNYAITFSYNNDNAFVARPDQIERFKDKIIRAIDSVDHDRLALSLLNCEE